MRRQLNDLGTRIGITFQPVYVSKMLDSALHVPEKKPTLVNQRCVVYKFKCDTNGALFINSSVICVMQIMSVAHAGTYIRALMSTRNRSLANMRESVTEKNRPGLNIVSQS